MKKIVSILLFLLAGLAWAAPQLYVNDILSNPSRYYNSVVEIDGDVTNVTPGRTRLTSGSYTLTDELGGQIEVRTQDLPAIGKHFVVKGAVSQDAATSMPYLRELGRGTSGFPLVWLVVIIAIFVVLVVALLVIAFLPKRATETPQPGISPTPPSTQVAPPSVSPQTSRRVPTTKYEESSSPGRQPTEAYLDGIEASISVIEGPDDVGKIYPITKRESIIGRDGDIKLSEVHLTVSNEHASLTYTGEGNFTLTHLSRTNTTGVNGQDVSQSCDLKSGDEIQFGATKLRFEVQE